MDPAVQARSERDRWCAEYSTPSIARAVIPSAVLSSIMTYLTFVVGDAVFGSPAGKSHCRR